MRFVKSKTKRQEIARKAWSTRKSNLAKAEKEAKKAVKEKEAKKVAKETKKAEKTA